MLARSGAGILLVCLSLLVTGPVEAGPVERAGAPACRASQLGLTRGPELSPATGQSLLALRLTNRGGRTCELDGYPTIELSDRAGAIPFSIARGGDQRVAPRRPARVTVPPAGSAFVLVGKYRCDLGVARPARALRLGLSGGALTLALPEYPRLGYCGEGDAGSTIAVSPFAPSVAATLRP